MKKIGFLTVFIIAAIICSDVAAQTVVSQVEQHRDALVAEQLCNQYLNESDFSAAFQNGVQPGLITELGSRNWSVFSNDIYRKIRYHAIHLYMTGQMDPINFEAGLNNLVETAVVKINQEYDQGAHAGNQINGFNTQNSFVAKILTTIQEEDNNALQIRGPGDPCTNPDFEMCDFTNWNLITGTVPTSPSGPYSFNSPTSTTSWSTTNTYGGSGSDQHYICNGGTDGLGGFPMVYPGGTCSAEIGDFTGTGNRAAQIRQTFLVSSNNAILVLNYAVCLEDPGTSHTMAEKPYFRMRVYDQSNNSITCGAYEAIAGDGQPGWSVSGSWQYKPWTTVFIPLAPYIGQNITVEFTVGDCSQGGHAGYAYVDASCEAMAFNMSANAVCAGQPITITGPPGAASYQWNTGATTQSITTSSPGTYSVVVTPVTGSSCSITLDTTVQASPIPVANFTDNAPACAGSPVTFTDQSNPNGATISTWAWDFGDGGTSSSQSPTHTFATAGNYNVTLTVTSTAGCSDNITIPVTINPGGTPVINAAGPFCSTDPAVTLTLSSGSGGTWSATCGSCINASTGQFDPAQASVGSNTITYTIGGACGGSDTETITIESITLNSITPQDVDCNGNCNGQIAVNATGATQYSDDGGSTFQPASTFTALCAGTYNIVAQSAIGCQVTSTATINEPTALTLPTSFVDETCYQSCDGEAIVAPQGGTSPYSYSWSTGAGNVPTIQNLCSGTYTVTVTDAHNCTGTADITVSGPAQVVITNIANTMETCQGACDGTITITCAVATQFSIDGGVTFQASNVFTNVCSGNYNIVVKDANGCQATGTTTVTSPNPMTLTVGNDTTICIGGTATLTASAVGGTAPVSLIWDNALPNGSPQSVSPAVNTTYSVFAQDANGCVTPAQTITVSINPPLTVQAFNDTSLCAGSSATITAQAAGGNGGPYTYSWDDGNGNILNGQTQTVTPSATTTYTVTASDNCGTPTATDQVTVTVNANPVVTFVADTLNGCTPVAVNFTNTTDPNLTGNCFWDFGDGTTSNNCVSSHTFTTPGCYDITLTVTSPQGCVGTHTESQYICVYPYPVANFTFSPQPADILNPEINFTNTSTGGSTYIWNFAGLDSSVATNPTYTFPDAEPNSYEVCLQVTNQYGCVDNTCQIVVINDFFTLYVPNAFTPDGDGKNDLFFAYAEGVDPTAFELMVFDRWGELIFTTTSPNGMWDGKYRGENCKEDVYVWKIKCKDNILHKKHTYYGHVSLLR